MRSLLAALAVAGLGTLAPGTGQAAQTYVCRLAQHGPGDWIPSVLFVGHDAETGQVVISDPIVLYFAQRPIAGQVAVDNARRITFAWTLPAYDRAGTYVSRMIYRATYLKSTRRMRISATPAGHPERFLGRGTCMTRER